MAASSTFRGIAFPFDRGATSFPQQNTDAELVKQSIIQILLTEQGERLMRPTFGSGLMSKVFENNGALLESLIQAEVRTAIGKWEPRAMVQGVDIQRKDSTITVTVSFIVISNRQQSAVSLQLSAPK
jgi:phage baseplate assembly protein W